MVLRITYKNTEDTVNDEKSMDLQISRRSIDVYHTENINEFDIASSSGLRSQAELFWIRQIGGSQINFKQLHLKHESLNPFLDVNEDIILDTTSPTFIAGQTIHIIKGANLLQIQRKLCRYQTEMIQIEEISQADMLECP